MKKPFALLLALGAAALLLSCARTGAPAGRYVREKGGFGGDFTLTLKNGGAYEYYEGPLSSYIGSGSWTEKDGVLTLREEGGYGAVFRFAVRDGALVYLADGSDDFLYVAAEDGDRFLPEDGA